MKKLFLFAAVAAFTISTAFAQDEIRYGIKGGVNYSNVSRADLSIKLNSKVGFHLGGVISYKIGEKVLIQTEPMYSLQGYVFPESSVYTDVDGIPVVAKRVVHLHYINLPIIAGYELAKGLSVQAGPQVGVSLGGKVKFKDVSSFGNSNNLENANLDLSTIELGVLGGLQYELPSNIFFQLRYVLGLTGISGKGSFKNNNAQLSIGYKFN